MYRYCTIQIPTYFSQYFPLCAAAQINCVMLSSLFSTYLAYLYALGTLSIVTHLRSIYDTLLRHPEGGRVQIRSGCIGTSIVPVVTIYTVKNPPIRPGLMHEGCAGEGRSTRIFKLEYGLNTVLWKSLNYILAVWSSNPQLRSGP